MGEGSWVRSDVDEFFEWLLHFEAAVRGLGGGMRWYRSDALQARVYYSWFDENFAGLPAVCVRDALLVHPLNGLAFLQSVAESFARGLDALDAEVLVVRRPHSPQLCDWLPRSSFNTIQGEATASWYLHRGSSRLAAKLFEIEQ